MVEECGHQEDCRYPMYHTPEEDAPFDFDNPLRYHRLMILESQPGDAQNDECREEKYVDYSLGKGKTFYIIDDISHFFFS